MDLNAVSRSQQVREGNVFPYLSGMQYKLMWLRLHSASFADTNFKNVKKGDESDYRVSS